MAQKIWEGYTEEMTFNWAGKIRGHLSAKAKIPERDSEETRSPDRWPFGRVVQ